MKASRTLGVLLATCAALQATAASAEWRAGSPVVTAAADDPRIAAVLQAVNRIDRALIDDDHAAFASMLASDLVVNNLQNGVSEPGATAQRNAGGLLSYTRYDRRIDFAGVRGGMVVLMGEETVVPKPPHPMAGQTIRRRFTDLWREDGGQWRLAIRRATILSPS